MRVGIVCPYSLTLPGGVQGQVLGLARALRSKGHPTRVLGPCDGPPPEAGITPLGNSIPTAANGSVAPIAPDLSAQLRLMRALREEHFDVLHLHEPFVPGPSVTAAVVRHTPIVATFHASGHIRLYDILAPLARWVNHRIDVRCAVSDDARTMAQGIIGGEFEMLFNGIEIDRFARAEPWPTDGPTVMFLGRHEERKGLDVLLAALTHLPRDVHLWIAGDGPQTESLQRTYAGDPRITWLGRISDAEKARRLRGADVYCAPSIGGESFGIVLLEAMASSVPIVAGDIDGYSQVARAGQEAILVEPGNPEALAAGITDVLRDPDLAAGLVARGDARAEEFSMHTLADRYLECYQRAIDTRAATPTGRTWRGRATAR